MVINKEIHNQIMWREGEILEYSALNGTSLSNLPSRFRELFGEEAEI